jgi:hypothetical protein
MGPTHGWPRHLVAPLPQLANSAGVLSVHHDAAHPAQLVLPVQQG